MSLLKKAVVEQSAGKVGIFGRQGSGKTTTSALITIGLSKTFHGGAPVAFFDTEAGSDFVIELFETEGIELLVVKSRAFKDMRAALAEAEKAGCCAYLVDSYTHPWQELTAAFKKKSSKNRLEFHHMDQLKTLWRGWTDQMLNSSLHVVLSGRLGFEWGEEEATDGGERKLVKLGSKLKGESEAGYEPSLLIEMEGVQDSEARMKKSKAKRGSIVHHALVLKDRWRSLNGRGFQFRDINTYKAGDYKAVFEAFSPHWNRLVIGNQQRALDGARTSEDLFDAPGGQSVFADRQRRKDIAAEEVQAMLVKVWPGQDAASKAAKQAAIKQLFDVYAWRSVEEKSLEDIERALSAMQKFVARADAKPPANHDAAIDLLAECRDAVNEETAPTQIGEIASEERLPI
jgi:hypothetical protein